MPSGSHEVILNIPRRNVWKFVSNMNQWAPLVPGYIKHEIVNKNKSIWTFKGDLGVIQKVIKLQVDIIESQRPEKIIFKLSGLNDNVIGSGFFKAHVWEGQKTQMIGYLDITAKGMMGPMINNILKSYVPRTTIEFTNAVKDKVNEIYSVPINI